MFRSILAAAFVAALMVPSGAARAGEVKVLTAGAMKAVVLALVPAFEAATGHKVTVDNDTAGGLARRIGGGEAFDVAVVTPKVIDDLATAGKIVAGTRADVAKVGMGVAIKAGTPAPDIATVAAFKAALLKSASVAYIDPKAGGSSGIYFDKLLERLGIADQVRPKARLKTGGYVAEAVVSGEAEIAIHQISEIVPVKGALLVGPLPADIQNITVYSSGLGSAARDVAAAQAFLRVLVSADAAAVLREKGMEKP
jgi:molybdate transport system substrate-binding protein